MSEAEDRLADAIEKARKVQRPDSDTIGVGTQVVVIGPRVRRLANVVEIGRTWISVSGVTFKFRKDTLRANTGDRTAWRIKTLDQDRYDRRMDAARERLRRTGIALSGVKPPPDGHVLAYAALTRLLAERGAEHAQ